MEIFICCHCSPPGLLLLHWLRGLSGPVELRLLLPRDGGESGQCLLLWLRRAEILLHQGRTHFIINISTFYTVLSQYFINISTFNTVLSQYFINISTFNTVLSQYFSNISTPGGPEDLREGREVQQHSHPGLGLILPHHTRRYNNLSDLLQQPSQRSLETEREISAEMPSQDQPWPAQPRPALISHHKLHSDHPGGRRAGRALCGGERERPGSPGPPGPGLYHSPPAHSGPHLVSCLSQPYLLSVIKQYFQ